jgi:hypothetical protein
LDSEDDESSNNETEEEQRERENNVGDEKNQSGISVEHVPEVDDMKTLKGREIAHKFNTGWEVGTVKGVEKSDEIAVFYESDSQLWKKELDKKDYGVDKYWDFFQKINS